MNGIWLSHVCGGDSRVDVVLDEVVDRQVVADLGKVHGRVLVLGQDVAVSAVLQQEAHYVRIAPLARLQDTAVEEEEEKEVHYTFCY